MTTDKLHNPKQRNSILLDAAFMTLRTFSTRYESPIEAMEKVEERAGHKPRRRLRHLRSLQATTPGSEARE
jgi:hypothetical protein